MLTTFCPPCPVALAESQATRLLACETKMQADARTIESLSQRMEQERTSMEQRFSELKNSAQGVYIYRCMLVSVYIDVWVGVIYYI